MNLIGLSFRYLWSRPLATLLNLLLMALGLASITFVLLVADQVERAFERDLAGIDAVVGAKGSAMQLILAGVFHIDVPAGNVTFSDVQELQHHSQVAQVIPISLGDNFQGYRIVGSTPEYLLHYGARMASGQGWTQPMQVILGAQVAKDTQISLGQRFAGAHGLTGNAHEHADAQYQVSGILQPCSCVLDRLIVTSTESVWQVHENELVTDESDRRAIQAEREVTMALVRYKTPLAAVSFPRFVNASTPMQAAAPALEMARLMRMLGVGTQMLQALGVVLLLAAGLAVFITLWSAVRERRADLAMLRMLGAPPSRLAALLLLEALWLAVLACALGLLAGHAMTSVVGHLLQAERSLYISGWHWISQEAWAPVMAVGGAGLAALIPAFSAYRVDVAQLLNSR